MAAQNSKNKIGYMGVKLHQFLSFSPIFQRVVARGGDTAFFPGCSLMGYDPELMRRVYRWLVSVHPGMGFVSACCGHPTLALGGRGRAAAHRERLASLLGSLGIKRLVVCCPNCSGTLKEDFGLSVISIWKLLDEERFTCRTEGGRMFVLHDPCPTRSDPETQQAARNVFARCGVEWEEYPSSREKARCCGKTGMMMVLNPEKGREVLNMRIAESDNRNILTYCFACVESFVGAGCSSVHGLELLFPGVRTVRGTWRNRIDAAMGRLL